MSVFKAQRLSIPHKQRRELRTQFGALCWRMRGEKIQFLLITSRRRGRWIIPKGWAVPGETPAGAAQTEAFEEAGVKGKADPTCAGIYSYTKFGAGRYRELPCVVAVYPIKVRKLLSDFPEKGQRRRKWVSRKKAQKLIKEPELREILRTFKLS